jgi:GAF domain-containing protein
MPARETQLVETFVTLTDTLVADYDTADVLHTLVDQAVELFDAAAGAIHLYDDRRALQVVASTSHRSEFIGLSQLNAGEGPCLDACSTGELVTVEDSREMHRRWPRFTDASRASGYDGVHAIPLRLRAEVVGSLNLFRETEGPLNGADARAAQALADVATISVLQRRSLDEANSGRQQLRHALDSRIVIEQAKGFVAQSHGVDVDRAFQMIRQHARSHATKLTDVARAIIDHRLSLDGPGSGTARESRWSMMARATSVSFVACDRAC